MRKAGTKSRNALHGRIVNLRRGLAIYKVLASPFWRVRVWIPSQRKRLVRTTKAKSRIEAISAAEEFLSEMGTRGVLGLTPKNLTFDFFANRLVQIEKRRGEAQEISARAHSNSYNLLNNPHWGPSRFMGREDIRKLKTTDYLKYMERIRIDHPHLTVGTLNHIAVVIRKAFAVAQNEGVIDSIPAMPRIKRVDNPRPFFRFYPLVAKAHDDYQLLLRTARKFAKERMSVRGTTITRELHDFIVFMTQTFLRPTASEVYALTHRDVVIAANPKRLVITIRKGKTGHRIAYSMPTAVDIYRQIRRHSDASPDAYVFLPAYINRSHALRVVQNQFNAVLQHAGLKKDRYGNADHSVYSLRHTAICMRLVQSAGEVNVFTLAKNAGTSVDQIERFYARFLPMNAAMLKNFHRER